MHKKSVLFPFVLCAMLLLGAHRMPAPTQNPIGSMPESGIPGPLDTARGDLLNRKVEAIRRSLTAVLAMDAEGKHPAMDFTQNDKQIFLVWQDQNGSKEDQIRVSWVAEAVRGMIKGKSLGEETQTLSNTGSTKSSFLLSPAKASLPAGNYRARLYKNSILVRILKFTVKR